MFSIRCIMTQSSVNTLDMVIRFFSFYACLLLRSAFGNTIKKTHGRISTILNCFHHHSTFIQTGSCSILVCHYVFSTITRATRAKIMYAKINKVLWLYANIYNNNNLRRYDDVRLAKRRIISHFTLGMSRRRLCQVKCN